MFAVGIFGVEEMCSQFQKDHDDFSEIMCKALADRLVTHIPASLLQIVFVCVSY